ncbi:unnamed protein product, partial [Laminaria digitata]
AQQQHHKRHVIWGVPDFVGKFHLNRMNTSTPIPGTAIRVEQERNALIEKRASSLKGALDDIETRRCFRVASRTRKAAITARVEVQATVGYRMDAVQHMYQVATARKKKRLSSSRYVPDDDFRTFLGYVEANNTYQVKSRLRTKPSAERLVATAEERHDNTALHRAVSLGFVEMTSMLLEAGASLDEPNSMGDAPIHCCWRFWRGDTSKYFVWRKDPYLMTTKQQLEDFARMETDVKTTVVLLKLLTRSGADVDLQRNNGEVALHTAARRGPLQAIWALLLCKAAHDVVDRRLFTPESAARRAGNHDFVTLFSSWPIVRLKYLHSEFVQEWMKFLCDPEANLDVELTAEEVLAQVRMEGHEEKTAVRARGGHLLIDEVITGPVMSTEEKTRVKMLAFSADAVSLTTTLEGSASTGSSGGGGGGGGGGGSGGGPGRGQGEEKKGGSSIHRNGGGGGGVDENEEPVPKRKTKSKLGKEIDVYLAQARDENTREIVSSGGVTGEATAYSRLVAKAQLEGRKGRWPGPRDNGKSLATVGGEGAGASADPFGRPMTTSQRRRIAAIEVAEDGGVEGPLLRPATSSMLLTTRSRTAKKETTPHPFYGRRLVTQRLLNQREREAGIKPTATIGVNTQGRDDLAGDRQSRTLYLNETRTAFNDTKLLPGAKEPGLFVDGPGQLHTSHPVMMQRKLHERPYCELQGNRKHNENVYCSTLEDYCPTAWTTTGTHEPAMPVRRRGSLG